MTSSRTGLRRRQTNLSKRDQETIVKAEPSHPKGNASRSPIPTSRRLKGPSLFSMADRPMAASQSKMGMRSSEVFHSRANLMHIRKLHRNPSHLPRKERSAQNRIVIIAG